MKLGIMQPYIFPYIGYFQLMNAVDEFVIYDNIEYTKKGWINRNRILVNGHDSYITLPLKKDSDYLDIRDRFLSDKWALEKKKMLNKIAGAYKKSPNFDFVFLVIKKCLEYEETNLFKFILNSINAIKEYCEIQTPLIISSIIPLDHELKSEKKVIEICKARKADIYINPIGGTQLYAKENFNAAGIELRFLKSKDIIYKQFTADFVPCLSIIDVMMFNSREEIKKYLGWFTSE
jgi:hypothetical protein